jgi:hypothetical protein
VVVLEQLVLLVAADKLVLAVQGDHLLSLVHQ